jgi:hypothetical protein
LANDQSQIDVSMTVVGSTHMYEAETARFVRQHPRTIGWRLEEVTSSSTGYLWVHGSVFGERERVDITTSSLLRVVVNGATVLSQTVTGLSGSEAELLVAWTSVANPATTGASDAVLSWITIFNVTTGTRQRYSFTHAAKAIPATATDAIVGSFNVAGSTEFSGVITGFWYSHRAMTLTEIEERWESSTAAPSTDVDAPLDQIPVTRASGIGDADEFYGPAQIVAAASNNALNRRHFSPLVNEVYLVPAQITVEMLGSSGAALQVPGAPDHYLLATFLRVAPVPEGANCLWLQAHVRHFKSSGAGSVQCYVRCYSMSKIPTDTHADPFVSYYAEVSLLATTTPVEGHLLSGTIPIARGVSGHRRGKTYLCLSVYVDPDDASSQARVEIYDWHVVPRFRQPGAGGLPLGGFG